MVRVLHEVPYILEVLVLSLLNLGSEGIQLSKCLVLEVVAEPCGNIALLICPRHCVGAVQHSYGLQLLSRLANGSECHLASCQHRCGQCLNEVEDASRSLLVLTKCLVVHEEVYYITCLSSYPASELIRCKGPLGPTLVREAEGDVVSEFVVAQQEAELVVVSIGIYEVWRLPTKDVLSTLCQHCLEAQVLDHLCDVVRVDKLGIAEGCGLNAELLLKHLRVELNLIFELLSRSQRRE